MKRPSMHHTFNHRRPRMIPRCQSRQSWTCTLGTRNHAFAWFKAAAFLRIEIVVEGCVDLGPARETDSSPEVDREMNIATSIHGAALFGTSNLVGLSISQRTCFVLAVCDRRSKAQKFQRYKRPSTLPARSTRVLYPSRHTSGART